MEKLILRSIMYGADKIPDAWFEKIPGGYYRDKNGVKHRVDNDNELNSDQKRHSNGESSKRSGRDRRNSTGDDVRRPPPSQDDRDDSGYRSEGPRRRRHHRPERSSYDGGDDEDRYSGEDRQRRRQHGSDRRRRKEYDDDRYGYEDGHRRPPPREDRSGDPRRQPYPEHAQYPYVEPSRQTNAFSPRASVVAGVGTGAAVGAAAGMAYANGNGNDSPASPAPFSPSVVSSVPRSPRTGSIAGGYVPYAHIYGNGTDGQQTRSPFSPPPASSSGSAQPHQYNQVSPQVTAQGTYVQNPLAQQAPLAAAAAAGTAYADQVGYYPDEQGRSARPDRGYVERYGEDNEPPYSGASHPPRRGQSRRDYSPSYDSYDERESRRRPRKDEEDDPKRAKSQGRGKPLQFLKENFDISDKGLGYSAVGAVAGGLLASEVGKGPIPMAIGAALGGLGANAFEARERYVDPRAPPSTQPPPRDALRRKKDDGNGRGEARKGSGTNSD